MESPFTFKDKPEVKIILDSVNPYNNARFTTFQLKYWRPILAETNTHRKFTRNASSSRAQSFKKRCETIYNEPTVPTHWNAEQKGMQGGMEFPNEVKDLINNEIGQLARLTIDKIQALNSRVKAETGYEIHKQYLNRYLEPFTQVTQLISATNFDNFFKLRMSEEAQPEINDVATEMFWLLNENQPVSRKIHLPYISMEDLMEYGEDLCTRISVARCARVCVHTYDGQHYLLEKDLGLHDMLLENGHMSPFEHIALADNNSKIVPFYNLDGWKSYRYALDNDLSFGCSEECL